MVIYPVAYIVLSLPIAAGRMAMARGITPSPAYFCAAAAIITSSGVVDVTIYTLTRRKLIMDTARALQEGMAPPHLEHQTRYTVRSGGCVTHKEKDLPAVMVERFGDPAGYVGQQYVAAAE